MYIIDQEKHENPKLRWALPERVFFACGACHILAYAFLNRYPNSGYGAIWFKPGDGFRGNHIVATDGENAFDYHGYSRWSDLRAHFAIKANRWWPGWRAEEIPLPQDVLVSEEKSKTYDGLWLREPGQFLHNVLPRAEAFIRRFPAPPQAGPQAPHSAW